MSGKLIVIPTPIGNLEDITLRSIRMLKEVDLILAEDTRTSGKLLKHLNITKPLKSYHLHNEHKIVEGLVKELMSGSIIGLVSDAGTPAISDPGFLLVREAKKNGVEVDTLPGATAFVPALVNSGLSCERFIFEGFLPVKKGRQTKLKQIAEYDLTTILYESPYRVIKTIEQLIEHVGEDRLGAFSRELTKMHEESITGTLAELRDYLKAKATIKGEFVLIIEGKK